MAKSKKKTNNIHGKFFATVSMSTRHYRAEAGDEPSGIRRRGGRGDLSRNERKAINRSEAQQSVQQTPTQAAKDLARYRTLVEQHGLGGEPKRTDLGPEDLYNSNRVDAEDVVINAPRRAAEDLAHYKTTVELHQRRSREGGPTQIVGDQDWTFPRVTSQERQIREFREREGKWRTEPNVYRVDSSKERLSPGAFINQAAPGHQKWINAKLDDPNSEFNKGLDTTGRAKTGRLTPGQRQRLTRYTDALQRGETHERAYAAVSRTRQKADVGRRSAVEEGRLAQGRELVGKPKPSGQRTKFQSGVPRANEFTFGVGAAARPSLQAAKRMFPANQNFSLQDQIQIQQAGTEAISTELLANQAWAHESRQAQILGQQSGKRKENPNRVTIFTTNLGHPSVSVPSDSLVGQYIIKKRKSVLGSSYGVPASQLKGQFPDAIRDQHIIDIATGSALGIKGKQGVYTTTGYRFGKKSSSGYGKPRPLGAQILTDSAGRPLYDTQGNIRYTEGATRDFDWSTPSLGARILIG